MKRIAWGLAVYLFTAGCNLIFWGLAWYVAREAGWVEGPFPNWVWGAILLLSVLSAAFTMILYDERQDEWYEIDEREFDDYDDPSAFTPHGW